MKPVKSIYLWVLFRASFIVFSPRNIVAPIGVKMVEIGTKD